ncbi:MAG: extracellular solute-binding protein, partial [Lachnospiraceae bacterium]|nr:extracellular solute-binding protein [Lachnospiraceae bacterium]
AYRQLLMVIGSSPDSLRDYQLDLKTPGALQILKEQYEVVQNLSARVKAYSKGSSGSESASLDNLIVQLENMSTKPETIAKQWSAFKDNIISLGSWSLSMKEQPLQIDYLLVQGVGSTLPKAKASFWQKILHEWRAFLASFTEDYESIGNVYTGQTIEVWMLGSGRDQATVLKNLVDNYFVEQKGIPANVKLVNADILLSATLAGQGPDVALGVAGKEPVNYALRHAAADLTQFEDFEDITGWFMDGALDMFRLDGGVYALPQTSSFQMLFYRADILKELGLEVPRTWDEFYECLSVIQKSNMNIGIVPDYISYGMYLYQHGGSYYSEDRSSSGLDSEEAVQAFSQWTSNYVDYRMPVTYDFANRFRTGEMPLAIADYTSYSYLSVFAPEIKGLWGFTTVPGYEDENGNIDRSVLVAQTASIILDTSDRKAEAWEFLKWWMSEDTQTSYGTEVENVLGVAGRVATSNVFALQNLPWTTRDLRQLEAQLAWVKVVPEIPGGYFTERHVKNAFYAVYNNNDDPRETLEDYVKTIDNEIRNKRIEFGYEN